VKSRLLPWFVDAVDGPMFDGLICMTGTMLFNQSPTNRGCPRSFAKTARFLYENRAVRRAKV
jgi:hypothetical protein